MKLKAILFDLGSTLLEYENSSWQILSQKCLEESYLFLKEQNYLLPEFENYIQLFETEFQKSQTLSDGDLRELNFSDWCRSFIEKLNLKTPQGTFQEFVWHYYRPIAFQVTEVRGAGAVLEFFKKQNLKIGLISNTIFPGEFHHLELSKFGLDKYFDLTLYSCEVGYKKPHPYIFQKALAQLELEATGTVYIGDRLYEDVGGAQRVGIKAILKNHPGRDYNYPYIPDVRINSLEELPQIIVELFKNKK